MRIGGRVTVRLSEGPYKGTWARVDRLTADAVLWVARARFDAYAAAPDPGFAQLTELYRFFCAQARPIWIIEDATGPLVPTSEGMLRLPVTLGLALIGAWLDTFPQPADVTPPPPEPASVPRGKRPPRGPAGSAAPAAAAAVAIEVP